ncbi:MarR family winged helix-turn-helix transcriptional regulator [Nonomuraea wenchangensis]|uniref:MarR family winged helix-turn-helix transcriptional regulator n=1 Tax=Nonomuraea wenchangensis TaxID=568860 RepID=UPI00332D4D73
MTDDDPMAGQPTPAALRALPSRTLSLVAMQADRMVSEGLARLDARKWHYAALVALREGGPVSQAELSRRTGIYRSDLVAVINELAERGHVERSPDPADRRRNVVRLTGRGREHLARLQEVVVSLQDELLAPLTPAEREQFSDFLTRVHEHHARR